MIDYKKSQVPKYEVKPITLKRTVQNQRLIQPQISIHNERLMNLNLNNERTLKIDDDKRKINNTMNNAT